METCRQTVRDWRSSAPGSTSQHGRHALGGLEYAIRTSGQSHDARACRTTTGTTVLARRNLVRGSATSRKLHHGTPVRGFSTRALRPTGKDELCSTMAYRGQHRLAWWAPGTHSRIATSPLPSHKAPMPASSHTERPKSTCTSPESGSRSRCSRTSPPRHRSRPPKDRRAGTRGHGDVPPHQDLSSLCGA